MMGMFLLGVLLGGLRASTILSVSPLTMQHNTAVDLKLEVKNECMGKTLNVTIITRYNHEYGRIGVWPRPTLHWHTSGGFWSEISEKKVGISIPINTEDPKEDYRLAKLAGANCMDFLSFHDSHNATFTFPVKIFAPSFPPGVKLRVYFDVKPTCFDYTLFSLGKKGGVYDPKGPEIDWSAPDALPHLLINQSWSLSHTLPPAIILIIASMVLY